MNPSTAGPTASVPVPGSRGVLSGAHRGEPGDGRSGRPRYGVTGRSAAHRVTGVPAGVSGAAVGGLFPGRVRAETTATTQPLATRTVPAGWRAVAPAGPGDADGARTPLSRPRGT
ncbi:hypothetical protein NX794_15955 [Streptomyces sp. LP11]|uniref:Uncharacterized protein n=1 Tax=Streptomyces pyxinicus TaxID=2970331 RepID=A0ABT2B2F6_9ACTN|nr:hypothetical protein [Streptomyces sp. LP11]MCS0602694.1 hypothetical protein [Streptomyces sp. LP11]